jgi:hypothetical protein
MELVVRRFEYGTSFTISKLSINNEYECYVLEDVVRGPGEKIAGETAIPAGKYTLIIDHSNRFDKDLPHILDVPMFEGVRIHSGNTDKDTEGCLLVGQVWAGGDNIGKSRVAFDILFPKLQKAFIAKESITIEIVDTKSPS